MYRVYIGTIAVIAMAFAGCAVSGSMPPVETLSAEGYVSAPREEPSLQRGRQMIVTECSECHRIYWPGEYSSMIWPYIVQDMGKRASLSPNQTEDIAAYYVAAARRSEDNASTTE